MQEALLLPFIQMSAWPWFSKSLKEPSVLLDISLNGKKKKKKKKTWFCVNGPTFACDVTFCLLKILNTASCHFS